MKDQELSHEEKTRLKIIAAQHPTSYEDIKKLYAKVKSFDLLKEFLNYSTERGLNPLDVLDTLERTSFAAHSIGVKLADLLKSNLPHPSTHSLTMIDKDGKETTIATVNPESLKPEDVEFESPDWWIVELSITTPYTEEEIKDFITLSGLNKENTKKVISQLAFLGIPNLSHVHQLLKAGFIDFTKAVNDIEP